MDNSQHVIVEANERKRLQMDAWGNLYAVPESLVAQFKMWCRFNYVRQAGDPDFMGMAMIQPTDYSVADLRRVA